MKYLVASVILFFCTLQTFGQQDYFIYLQTDNSQAFYIRINNAVYSSTSTGYLILSKLPDSTASVTIGFAKNVFPEQQFNIPVNHKDAGYTIKNLGDKGWGLFNLQTMAVIMSSTPAEEKKSPEINGIRKNDAFSLLLANAVNDTAVLYVVNKPPKPAPAPVVITDEKKKDTVALVKQELVKKDSTSIVQKPPAHTDSTRIAKNKTDSLTRAATTARARPQNNKPSTKASNPHDTATLVKNKPVPPLTPGKNAIVKPNTTALGKTASKQHKDSIIVARNNPTTAPPTAIATKNNKERKDTIILMNNKPAAANKAVAKNTPANKPSTIKKDSLPLVKKETSPKPEEKIISPVTQPPVVAQNLPPKKDSLAANPPVKKDTVTAPAAVAVAEKAKPASDTPAAIIKRTGPLVTKAAELFTDTSYVAVFVDESKDVFDTIRISIPFFETLARAAQQVSPPVPVVKEIQKADSNAAIVTNTPKDSAAALVTATPAPVKNDSAVKTIKDSVHTGATTRTTDTARKTIKDSSTIPPATLKKQDTLTQPPIADSGLVLKPLQQTVLINSDCKEIAWDSDIDKLRIKMLVVATDDERITLAKKLYRLKCFSVKQVRALSELFKTDEGKYKWFDAVYPFVTDSSNFSSLGEQIKNEYYLNRFKAMLRN